MDLPTSPTRAPIVIDRRMLGPGYGHATAASLSECEIVRESLDLGMEPIYGGKAMAALRLDAPQAAGEHILFWHTNHRGTLSHSDEWERGLPVGLQRRLMAARAGRLPRRQFVGIGLVAATTVALSARLSLHEPVAGWEGHVLFEWQGAVLIAAAEALLPDVPGEPIPGGVPLDLIAVNVDRYLLGMPQKMRTEVHGLFALIEHGTGLDRSLARFTRLSPASRRRFVETLLEYDNELGQAAKGLRDFVYLGYYQDARAWPSLHYGGPWVDAAPRPDPYDALLAPAGTMPRGLIS